MKEEKTPSEPELSHVCFLSLHERGRGGAMGSGPRTKLVAAARSASAPADAARTVRGRRQARRQHRSQGIVTNVKVRSRTPDTLEKVSVEYSRRYRPPPRTGGKTTGRWAGSPAALTKVIVVHHRVGRPHPGPLLGEVVAEFEKRCVLFQHAHNLHFHFVAQRLAL